MFVLHHPPVVVWVFVHEYFSKCHTESLKSISRLSGDEPTIYNLLNSSEVCSRAIEAGAQNLGARVVGVY